MSVPLFDLLAAHDRQEALIEGLTRLRGPMQRPRVVIPLSSRTSGIQLDPPRPQLRAGASVRLLDAAHLGQIGQVRTRVVRATPASFACARAGGRCRIRRWHNHTSAAH